MNATSPASPTAIERQLPWGPVVRGLRWGSGSDRVLLLHEPGADIDAWRALPATLAHRLPLDVIAVDLPGHGLSDDPWQEEQLPEMLHETFYGKAETERAFIIAAGATALTALDLAAKLALTGLVLLSPTAPVEGSASVRSVRVPKLFFAGALAGADVRVARDLAKSCGGWAVVTAVPLAERGTALLTSAWQERIIEQTLAFLGDCLHRPTPTPTRFPVRRERGFRR